jgi:hypothetical protein
MSAFGGKTGRDAMFAKGSPRTLGTEFQLYRARTLAPLGLPKIALARVRPSARVAAEDVAQFVDYIRPNSLAPAGKSLARRPSRALLLPSSAHHGNLERVGPVGFRLCFCHAVKCRRPTLKSSLTRNAMAFIWASIEPKHTYLDGKHCLEHCLCAPFDQNRRKTASVNY